MGHELFGNRLVHSFEEEEIREASLQISKLQKELYIQMNLIIHNNDIEHVNNYLDFLKTIQINGIFFGDLGLYNLAKAKGLAHLLIYNPETLNTNYYDPIFWHKKGIKGLTISKEITLEDIERISSTSDIDISIIGHGHLNMFHSRRPLIENYFKYNKEEFKEYIENKHLRLVEETRNEAYPVFQDIHGTHIFREKSMESFSEISRLSKSLDVFIVDGIFKDSDYVLNVLTAYKKIIQTNKL